jgi:hypothetical protein
VLLREFHEGAERTARGSGIDGLGGDRDAVNEAFRLPGRDQRRGGIRQDDVAVRPRFALEHAAEQFGVRGRIPAAQRVERGATEAEILGCDVASLDGAVAGF